jgi:hypothetical protein
MKGSINRLPIKAFMVWKGETRRLLSGTVAYTLILMLTYQAEGALKIIIKIESLTVICRYLQQH